MTALPRWNNGPAPSSAVLTETLHLVGPGWRAQKTCLEFILRGAFQLVPSSTKSLQRVAVLMERYRNVPISRTPRWLFWRKSLKPSGCSRWTAADFPFTECIETELSKSSPKR
jgi:hypothetical protein